MMRVYILAALGIVAWLIVAVQLFGCGPSSNSAPQTTPAQADLMPMPWCASVLFTNGAARRGCAPTEDLCEVDAEKVRKLGAVAHVRWVGQCRRSP
jgi:hypothetical protein